MTQPENSTISQCFTCNREIPFSPRYPERICELCLKTAVNGKGEKLSFHNEAISGGFVSHNHTTNTNGTEHTCFVKGNECYADEAYMGGIVLVPTEKGKDKKTKLQLRNRKIRNIVLLISVILAPVAIGGAYAISLDGYFNEGFTLFDVLMITGSICLFLFCILSFYRYKVRMALAALLYLATGYYAAFYYGYRNDAFLDAVAIISLVSGVLLVTAVLSGTGYIGRKMKDFQERRQQGNSAWLLLVIIPVFVLIGLYVYLYIKGGARAETIIATAPGATTVALVKDVREYRTSARYSRNNPHNDALLQYSAGGKTYYRILDNMNTHYTTGSQLEIRYVVNDPYLIVVLK